jgi:4-hydroxybenzoate polyprenyltransferase
VVLCIAVLTGQLTIGWSNDRLDWRADRAVGRMDKPVATGAVPLRTIDNAIAVAGVACVAFSLALGWRAGLTHLGAVGCGWLYNAVLKGTWLSWLPYAAAFAALPAIATMALPGHPLPAGWVVLAAALIGVGANLTNALPDLERDSATGFRGLPGRLGARPSASIAVLLLLLASALVAAGPPGPVSTTGWVGFGLTLGIVVVTFPLVWRSARTRLPFYGLMALVPIDVIVLLVGGHRLR